MRVLVTGGTGYDAVVHAAAVFALDVARSAEVERTNARAAELVLSRAVAKGLDPVVPVPFEDSLRDTTRWLVEAARLPAKYAGRAAPTR